MLKNSGYSGAYRDDDITVDVIMENPLNHGLNADTLAFGVMVKPANNSTVSPRLDDVAFYIMDEANNLYNTRTAVWKRSDAETDDPDDDKSAHTLRQLIYAALKPEWLYQDMRVAFHYKEHDFIGIISLGY